MKPTKTTTSLTRNSINRSPLRRGVLLIALVIALAWLALSPTARAVSPPPDGGYPNNNTAEGENALFSLTIGNNNTAVGFHALFNHSQGPDNTAIGYAALSGQTAGSFNTAIGASALLNS